MRPRFLPFRDQTHKEGPCIRRLLQDSRGVSGALLGILVLALLGATGLLIALILPGRGIVQRALAAYVVASAEVVALSFFLSAFDAMTRGALIAGAILLFVAALAAWQLTGAPRPVSLRAGFVHVDTGRIRRW